eukprot:Tamp_04730.p1 GENE.Tamp_04730~~Tamp_04730.p1  ORF type:complete len:581 (-),score=106.49 Tamp_04730:25-1767(-)
MLNMYGSQATHSTIHPPPPPCACSSTSMRFWSRITNARTSPQQHSFRSLQTPPEAPPREQAPGSHLGPQDPRTSRTALMAGWLRGVLLGLLVLLAPVASAPPAGVVDLASVDAIEDAVASSNALLIAFLSEGCARSRQAAANLEWAATELAADGLQSDATIAKVQVQRLSHSDWLVVSQQFGLQEGDGHQGPAVKWLATPLLINSRQELERGAAVETCDAYTSANGLYDFVKGALAAKEVGAGMEACQACRRVLEGMHHDWHDLLSRLLAAKALSIESAWQVKLSKGRGAQAAVMGVCSSAYMQQLSNSTRHAAAALFKWHGQTMVAQHLQLFASWCRRSGDGARELTEEQLLNCARQWSAKVPNGRLGLHEKIMGMCGQELGGVAKVCRFQPSGWQATKRLPPRQQIRPSRCAACRAVADDMAFVLATSKLADLRARVLRARWLDVQLLLDDLCQDAFNRHEGDATEGPARIVNAVCSDLLDEYSDQVLQAGIHWLASQGGGAEEQADAALVSGLDRRICVDVSRLCTQSALSRPGEWENLDRPPARGSAADVEQGGQGGQDHSVRGTQPRPPADTSEL